MKEENYELVCAVVTPAYTYIEGEKREKYWVDDQNMLYHFFYDEEHGDGETYVETRKYWVISPYKPKGTKITPENADSLIKWLVSFSWHTSTHPEHDDIEYDLYEWDFENHCIKTN